MISLTAQENIIDGSSNDEMRHRFCEMGLHSHRNYTKRTTTQPAIPSRRQHTSLCPHSFVVSYCPFASPLLSLSRPVPLQYTLVIMIIYTNIHAFVKLYS